MLQQSAKAETMTPKMGREATSRTVMQSGQALAKRSTAAWQLGVKELAYAYACKDADLFTTGILTSEKTDWFLATMILSSFLASKLVLVPAKQQTRQDALVQSEQA